MRIGVVQHYILHTHRQGVAQHYTFVPPLALCIGLTREASSALASPQDTDAYTSNS